MYFNRFGLRFQQKMGPSPHSPHLRMENVLNRTRYGDLGGRVIAWHSDTSFHATPGRLSEHQGTSGRYEGSDPSVC